MKSPWLAQDVALCFVDEPGYSIQLGYFVSPILTKDSLEEAVVRVQEVRKNIFQHLFYWNLLQVLGKWVTCR